MSLRQSVIPSHLLGRVNSVYRFFAWGMMPIGALIGGLTVTVVSHFATREVALRSAFFLDAAIYAALFVVGRSKLTTDKLEAARRRVSCLSSQPTHRPRHKGVNSHAARRDISPNNPSSPNEPRLLSPCSTNEAEYADIEGQLSPTVVDALHREGLLKIWVPEKLGGAELDPLHSLEVLENLSYGDRLGRLGHHGRQPVDRHRRRLPVGSRRRRVVGRRQATR